MFDATRRKTLKTLAGAGAFLAAGGVGSAVAAGHRQGASAGPTIVEIAVGSDDFETLVAAVLAADPAVLDALSDNRQYTVFAPTDDAFAALGLTPDTVGDLPTEVLTDILLYHVTPGRRYAASVVGADELEMLNGDEVEVDGTVLNDGQADIVATDVEASNGVIHVIDGVLLPPGDDDDDDADEDEYGDDEDDEYEDGEEDEYEDDADDDNEDDQDDD